MKVLHLISGGDTGGAKTHIISLIKGLDQLVETKIICFIEDSFYSDAKKEGINIDVFKQKSRSDLSVINRLIQEIKTLDYDIIHCHGARANFIAMFLRFKIKKPFITTMHSDYKLDFKDNYYKRIIYTTLNSIALKRFNYYIAISDAFKEMLVERGFNKEEIFVAFNGIGFDNEIEVSPKEDFLRQYNINYSGELIVGIMARLDLVKDHDTFLRAAKKALSINRDLIFLIAGEGNLEEKLRNTTKEFGIEDKVRFLGFLHDNNSFFNAIDINVLCSVSESFPYVILEGARLRKPIISTKVGGIANLVRNDYNGYLIDIADSNKLADIVVLFSQNKELIGRFGERLYQDAKSNYSYGSMAKTHLDIYNTILKDKGKKKT